jgi:ParB/RepB/Spo0J family partition protein
MPKSQAKIALSVSRDIPFNKLALSQANVRRIKAGVAIEELAEDIARRTLLQSLTVRPVLDEAGAETGMYEVPAGGRRYRALELLVKQKRLARTAPIPCIVRTEGIPEEDSLAENVQRAPLHPLDQFRAFLTLREKGQSEEEIAAVFFVSPNVVRQRLKLAAVSPKLLEVYAEDGMTLEQLMAFTVNPDHARQEQVLCGCRHNTCYVEHEIMPSRAAMPLPRLSEFGDRLGIIVTPSALTSRRDQHDHHFTVIIGWSARAQREGPSRCVPGEVSRRPARFPCLCEPRQRCASLPPLAAATSRSLRPGGCHSRTTLQTPSVPMPEL